MRFHPRNPLGIQRIQDPAGSNVIPVWIVFGIAWDDTADMHTAGGMDEIPVAEMNTDMSRPICRIAEEQQVARQENFQVAEISYIFAIPGLLRCIPGKDDPLAVKKQPGKARAIDCLTGSSTPQVWGAHHPFPE